MKRPNENSRQNRAKVINGTIGHEREIVQLELQNAFLDAHRERCIGGYHHLTPGVLQQFEIPILEDQRQRLMNEFIDIMIG